MLPKRYHSDLPADGHENAEIEYELRPQAFRKRLLSRDEIEAEYGITRRWLELAAHKGNGPPSIKISRRMVRYERAEIEAWLAARRVQGDDEEA